MTAPASWEEVRQGLLAGKSYQLDAWYFDVKESHCDHEDCCQDNFMNVDEAVALMKDRGRLVDVQLLR